MGKLFNTTMIVSVIVGLVAYFMFVAPMMAKNGNGNGSSNGTSSTEPAA